jgi:hypothetical protein
MLKQSRISLKIISVDERAEFVTVPTWWPDGRTDWPTDRRSQDNLTLTLTQKFQCVAKG